MRIKWELNENLMRINWELTKNVRTKNKFYTGISEV